MSRSKMLFIFFSFVILVLTKADLLDKMDQAVIIVPFRAFEVLKLIDQANIIFKPKFNRAAYKTRSGAVLKTETAIGLEINTIVGLSGQINSLHHQTLVRKGQEEANINSLNAQINQMAADVSANEQHLARLHAELANAEADLAEAEDKLENAKRKKRRRRRKWGRFIPIAGWVIRAIDHFKKEVPRRRQLRDSVMDTRNRVAAARDHSSQQKHHLQGQLTAVQQTLAANSNLLDRINALINRGNVAKQQLTDMHLYLGRLRSHLDIIIKDLDLVDKLAPKTAAEYSAIMKDSVTALYQFQFAQEAEQTKLQQLVAGIMNRPIRVGNDIVFVGTKQVASVRLHNVTGRPGQKPVMVADISAVNYK